MAKITRRKLLVTASTSAVAVGGTAALFAGLRYDGSMASAASLTSETANTAQLASSSSKGPLVAYVGDVTKGEVHIMFGQQEVVVHNPALVHQLLNSVH
jgi:hypothetical protein